MGGAHDLPRPARIVGIGAIDGGFAWRASRTPHRTDLFLDVRVPPTLPMARARAEVLDFVRSLRERFPEHGIESEIYVTAPGSEIDESHPLIAAIDAGHAEVFGGRRSGTSCAGSRTRPR